MEVSRHIACWTISFCLAGAGCGGARSTEATGADAESKSDDVFRDRARGAGVPAPGGENSITGAVGRSTLEHAAAAWAVRLPRLPNTVGVYWFSTPVSCDELRTLGWLAAIPNGTEVLEVRITESGTVPMMLPVVFKSPTPEQGLVTHYVAHPIPSEGEGAASGDIALFEASSASITVGFRATFAVGEVVSGVATAPFCDRGENP